jgi:hypothetical protein
MKFQSSLPKPEPKAGGRRRSAISQWFFVMSWLLLTPATMRCQTDDEFHQTVALQNPARPARVVINAMTGNLVISGYDGQDILVEAKTSNAAPMAGAPFRQNDTSSPQTAFQYPGITIKEADNTVSISVLPQAPFFEVLVQVPRSTKIKATGISHGSLLVKNLAGAIEAELANGNLSLTNVSGPVVAHNVNGNIFGRFIAGSQLQPLTFSSVNGAVDLGFNAALNANVKLTSLTGAIQCDFGLKAGPDGDAAPRRNTQKSRGAGAGQLGASLAGTINDGGPEISVKTVNGAIRLHRTQ